jgi:PleD family two-component response regulator
MRNARKKILIVDDDESHLMLTRELLHGESYEVLTHQNGFGVLAVVHGFQPDLVLLDVNMPALQGDKLAHLLRMTFSTRNVPIFFYSSLDEDILREHAADCGVQGYICKGDIVDMKSKIERYLS